MPLLVWELAARLWWLTSKQVFLTGYCEFRITICDQSCHLICFLSCTHTRAWYVSGIYAIVEMWMCVSEKRHKVNNLHFHSSHLFLYCLVACLGVGQGDRSPITAITATGGAGTFHFRAKKTTNAFPNCAKHRHKNKHTHTSTYVCIHTVYTLSHTTQVRSRCCYFGYALHLRWRLWLAVWTAHD